MYETSKSLIRRSFDKRFTTRWLVNEGIDIGSGNDCLDGYRALFPMMGPVRSWDLPDGDAMWMAGISNDS